MITSPVELRSFPDETALVAAAAETWLRLASSERFGPRSVALLGGRVAAPLFRTFTQLATARGAGLEGWHYFWGDERCVPPGDAESNYAVAARHLFPALGTPPERIHRVRGELPPDEAARQAERELRGLLEAKNPAAQPVLDLVLLGMGEDGHTASLFPHEGNRFISDPAVFRPVTAAKPPPHRVTMGYPVLAAARQVLVLVAGSGKDPALRDSLSPNPQTPLGRLLKLRMQPTSVFAVAQA